MSSTERPRAKAHRDRIKEPIGVFISSHQKEFTKIRRTLQARIERLEVSRKWLFVADVVEDYPGNRLKPVIDKLLSECSVFVFLVGRKQSKKWVKYELDYALSNGIPILVYEYHKKTSNPPPTETKPFIEWLTEEVGLVVRGHAPKFADADELIDAVTNDLLEQIGRSVKHYASIIREVNRNK